MIPRLKNSAKVIPLKVSGPLPFPVYEAGRRKTGTGAGTGETVRASDSVRIECIPAQPIKNRADPVPAFPGVYSPVKVGAEHEDDACRRCKYFVEIGPGTIP